MKNFNCCPPTHTHATTISETKKNTPEKALAPTRKDETPHAISKGLPISTTNKNTDSVHNYEEILQMINDRDTGIIKISKSAQTSIDNNKLDKDQCEQLCEEVFQKRLITYSRLRGRLFCNIKDKKALKEFAETYLFLFHCSKTSYERYMKKDINAIELTDKWELPDLNESELGWETIH